MTDGTTAGAETDPKHDPPTQKATAHDDATQVDARSHSEHDVDRILYSDELRRLGGVTQVVAVGEMPLFHTRLTHTLKVQQLARRMAEHLTRNPENAAIIAAIGGIDVSAAEAAGLAHDLGHPPFGHVGEAALHKLCQKAGLDGFEGNAQTFRILATLSRHGEDTPFGLGLTDCTLRAVIKYPWLREGVHGDDKKWNAYPTEEEAFNQARKGLLAGARSPEAAIMDWADDITYAVHDLEDFIRAGRVPMADLAADMSPELDAFLARALPRLKQKYKDAEEEINWDKVVASFSEQLSSEFAQFRIHTGTREQLAQLRSVCSRLIDTYVSAISLQEGKEPLRIPGNVRGEVELFKQLTWHYVIHNPGLATLQAGQTKTVTYLFTQLRPWLKQAETDGEMFRLPPRLVDLYAVTASEPGQGTYSGNKRRRQARAVADYIAGLTETQALDLHERLRGLGGHSVLDPWLTY